jgi:hypothetical protein
MEIQKAPHCEPKPDVLQVRKSINLWFCTDTSTITCLLTLQCNVYILLWCMYMMNIFTLLWYFFYDLVHIYYNPAVAFSSSHSYIHIYYTYMYQLVVHTERNFFPIRLLRTSHTLSGKANSRLTLCICLFERRHG